MRFSASTLVAAVCAALVSQAGAQLLPINKKLGQEDKFRQLEELLPTPNDQRTGSGAPGHEYWQQRADYEIEATLDDENQRLRGTATITYFNNSPDTLRYLWVQLERNQFRHDARGRLSADAWEFDDPQSDWDKVSYDRVRTALKLRETDYGYQIDRVASKDGDSLPHRIVETMMRVELEEPLSPGASVEFEIDWNFLINDSRDLRTRTSAEFFEDDGNYVYGLAHWFPRMAAYTDYTGWQHKQFLGRGEFTLEFGDYDVKLTVPDDHIVSATGELQNAREVLTAEQRRRWEEAKSSERPMFIVTQDEAEAAEQGEPTGTKTWHWIAEDVRDFAFASSRKFIWDAMGHTADDGHFTMCQSLYTKEAEPLWSQYSTHAVAHTLDVYNRFAFTYPYPTAISVSGIVGGGMEYPMICFNGPRPEEDGTYTKRTKYGLISVIIHEVGHFYFPMIVNTDERQWTWMDEGLNSFLQTLAEYEWEEDYPSRRSQPANIARYMASSNQRPIMTNSESTIQFGSNAYSKPATALLILRESVMGRENFDYAFREFSRRWKFKRPNPADFFRSMEDASGVDLDWFWRGWFYSTDHVDMSVENVKLYTIDTLDPDIEKPRQKADRDAVPPSRIAELNRPMTERVDRFPELLDFYNEYDELDVTGMDREDYEEALEDLEPEEADQLRVQERFYVVDLKNIGGLVMPIILELHYADGTSDEKRFPVESWVRDNQNISKMIISDKEIERVVLDPRNEMADADMDNNYWPRRINETRFELFKRSRPKNPMQKQRDWDEKQAEESDG